MNLKGSTKFLLEYDKCTSFRFFMGVEKNHIVNYGKTKER